MIITNDWVFIHIPRTGGRNFKAAYLKKTVEGHQPQEVIQSIGMLHADHAVFSLWEHYVGNQEVFSIVRNPYDRVTSHFRRYKDMCFSNDPELLLPDEMNMAINTSIDFPAYLTGQLSGWSTSTTQKEFIRSDTRTVKIYKFELELEKVYKDYDLQMFPAINASVSKDTPLDDPSNLGLVNEIFAEDFDEFGYEMKRV